MGGEKDEQEMEERRKEERRKEESVWVQSYGFGVKGRVQG